MTREEAANILSNDIIDGHVEGNARFMDAFWFAVDNLKAQPCEDAVSRESVLEVVNNPLNIKLDKIIEKLPPVTPKQRTGKWIPITNKNGTRIALRCDACGESPKHAIESDFCPNCGAKMEGESE